MKERPILFSTPMVRAILEGRKTQTRRVVKPQPFIDTAGNVAQVGPRGVTLYGQHPSGAPHWENFARMRCPHGRAGDRLWVRETWCEADTPSGFAYRADAPPQARGHGWRPSIHMPRRACRITLDVVGVRVERLNDISEADALAEGIHVISDQAKDGMRHFGLDLGRDETTIVQPTAVRAFRFLWDHINGPDAWAANPWVWVVEFERVSA